MRTTIRSRARRLVPIGIPGALAAALPVLIVAACGGGGGGGSGMHLDAVSIAPNAIWQINRPIQFAFSEDVDFSTVNMNSIHVGRVNGGTAVGEFSLLDSKTVQFQPRCPTLADNSDVRLEPGGVSYIVQVPGSGSGVSSVHSVSGDPLSNTLTIPFTTVNSSDPAVLFIDTKAGAPSPVIRATADDTTPGSYLELGDDPASRQYFISRTPVNVDLGLGMPEDPAFLSGLNLYSDVASHLSILVAVDQSVRASEDNINPSTVQLQYLTGSTTWLDVAHTVTLVANCSGTGALLRVDPAGILPQNHLVRVRFAPDFKDIVGNANIVPIVVASFQVGVATDPGTTNPGPASDEFREEFFAGSAQSPNSYEDTTSTLVDPRAEWGNNGLLKAGFAFTGTGGHNGVFDWKVGNDQPLTNTNHPVISLDTAFTQIQGENSDFQNVIGGIVDIRNFTVTASGTLLISGPNPCQILVSGNAIINGRIQLTGSNNLSVGTLDTTGQTEPGAAGNAGGGNGGNGNPLTTQSSPKGANGNGAFNVLARGGVGGESAYQPRFPVDGDDSHRRPAGGGGGTLGHDFLRPINIVSGYTNDSQCPDQSVIGYDAETGFQGFFPPANDSVSVGAIGVISNQTPPVGGAVGPRPFVDSDPENDFWGTMLHDQQLIKGELSTPWAGAGGGGGGNAIVSNRFPTTPFDPTGDEKGAGGGGGGGGLTILALGSITFGPHGRIDAGGGTGGGGENSLQTGDVTHIGGGSGGGSGGHIVLQTASTIDMTQLTSTPQQSPGWAGGLYALGGEGGAGHNNLGGAQPQGLAVLPCQDALPPPRSYPTQSGGNFTKGPCAVVSGEAGYDCTNPVGDPPGPPWNGFADGPALVVIGCGGDGGPGLIQLHAPEGSILKPTSAGETIYSVCKPPPVGSFPGTGVPTFSDQLHGLNINDPSTWNRLLPIFGRKTQAMSKWISLGDASVSSDVSTTIPNPIKLFFRGTDNSGLIQTSGAQVAELSPILTGTIQSGTTKPYIDPADFRTVVFDSSTIVDTDDIYLRNVLLFRRFLIRLSSPAPFDFEVAAATYDPASNTLRLTVDASGPVLQNMEGASVEVRPRFFRVVTSDTPNFLPSSSQIKVEFQATQPDSQGNPSLDPNLMSGDFNPDITTLEPNVSGHPNYRFLRFRVSFDIAANNEDLTPQTPIPGIDFLRMPFRF